MYINSLINTQKNESHNSILNIISDMSQVSYEINTSNLVYLPNDWLRVIFGELTKSNLFDILDDQQKRRSMYVDLACVKLTCKRFSGFLQRNLHEFPLVIGNYAGWARNMQCIYSRENGTLKQESIVQA